LIQMIWKTASQKAGELKSGPSEAAITSSP
jgi:hypothetical protein